MGRKFIATILAAALSVTAVSAPARADNQDIVKFLAGATALVIIGKAIHDSKKKDDKRDHVSRHDNRHDRHDRREGHRWNNHDRRISMPSECRVNVRTPRGTVAGYGYRCVQRDARLASAIPGQCVTATRANRGPRFIYDSRCLARNGIRVN